MPYPEFPGAGELSQDQRRLAQDISMVRREASRAVERATIDVRREASRAVERATIDVNHRRWVVEQAIKCYHGSGASDLNELIRTIHDYTTGGVDKEKARLEEPG